MPVKPDNRIFSFIEDSVIWFDRHTRPAVNFHLVFLAGLTRFLGFSPSLPLSEELTLFDMTNGVFTAIPPSSGVYMDKDHSSIMRHLITTPPIESETLAITTAQRRKMLELLIKFYSIHLPGFKNLKSMKILQEVFTS